MMNLNHLSTVILLCLSKDPYCNHISICRVISVFNDFILKRDVIDRFVDIGFIDGIFDCHCLLSFHDLNFKCVATIYQLIVKQTIPWIFTEFNTSNNALMSVSNSSFFFIRRFMFSVEADILRKKNWRIRFDQRPNQKMKIWTRHGTLIFSMWQKTNFK